MSKQIDTGWLRAICRDDIPAMKDWRTLFFENVPKLLDERKAMLRVLARLVPPDRLDLWSLEMFKDEEAFERQIKEMWITLGMSERPKDEDL